MGAWIGPKGGLVEVLQYRGDLSVQADRPSRSLTTLGGRVKVQRGVRARRVWDAGVEGLTPAESASLLSLEAGGEPPWTWVDPYAQVTNVLTPEQSLVMPGTWSGTDVVEGGAVTVDGVRSPRSVSHSAGGFVDFTYRSAGEPDQPAVIPGLPVSVSVYVRGSGDLGISWRDYTNTPISSNQKSYTHADMARVSMVNLIPPAGAVSAYIWVSGFTQAAMPALTWTKALTAWGPGRGCNRVVVEGLSEAVQQASSTGESYSAVSFTIREVG